MWRLPATVTLELRSELLSVPVVIFEASRLDSSAPLPEGLWRFTMFPGAPIVMMVDVASAPVPMLRSCSPAPVPMLISWQFGLVPMSTSSAMLVPMRMAVESRLAFRVPEIVRVPAVASVAEMCASVALVAVTFVAVTFV